MSEEFDRFKKCAVEVLAVDEAQLTPEASEATFFLADSMFQQREFVVARSYFSQVVNEGTRNKYYQLALQRLLEGLDGGQRIRGIDRPEITQLVGATDLYRGFRRSDDGIEPDIALVKYKQLAGGGMLKIVNNTVPLGLRVLGYDEPQIDSIIKFVDQNKVYSIFK